jgi:hypothetical protein
MSYSTDPVADAARHYDALDKEQEAQDRHRASLHRELVQVIAKQDANAVCPFSMTRDTELATRPIVWEGVPFRAQTLAEVLNDSLDYTNGPNMTEVMQLLLNARTSTDVQIAVQAGDLLDRMAASWANHQELGE